MPDKALISGTIPEFPGRVVTLRVGKSNFMWQITILHLLSHEIENEV
jgi:hypothetical protein